MLNDERRTPMKRAPFKRAAPTTKSHSNQAAALTSQALTAIKTRAPLRASTYAAPTEPAAPIAKSAPVRSEAYRRAVASLPCINCGVPGHSQCAHSNSGKGAGIKRAPFKRKNNAENIQSKVAQSHAQQARVVIIIIAKSAKKRAFNAVGCSESPKQSTCMRGLHA